MYLETRDLYASVEGKQILKGVNLRVEEGGTYTIMGPNGSGKSTL
ncbi:MAG: ATP-binding cassette domain-containing protein, partial [Nitrososphaerota archaeon]